MSFGFPPHDNLTPDQFYTQALQQSDSNKRRRLFADARSSNICSFQIYILGAEVEETWQQSADLGTTLKNMITKGVTVFKNPAGTGANCPQVKKDAWLREAVEAEKRGKKMTARAVREVVAALL